MSVTLTETRAIPIGQSEALCFGTILFDSSYPTGGEPVDATGDVGYSDLWITGTNLGYLASWDPDNQKLIMYRQKDPGATGGADIALVQVGNTVDLSAVTVHYGAIRPQ